MQGIFYEIGIIIIAATALAMIARMLKQPLIPAYVLTGVILGPVLHLVTSEEIIHSFSEIGIAFLLFIVGMEIEFKRLKEVGLVSTLGGTLQVLIVFILGYFISQMLGFSAIESVYVGVILSFGSTMVVVKILADLRELDTLHGRIVLGVLLIQDIIAIFALSTLATLTEFTSMILLISLVKALILALIAFLSANLIFPALFKFAAKSNEILFLTSISSCFLFGIIFHFLGFSVAIGAFVAGIILGNLPYNFEIIGRVKSIRDFFATLFFISLGMQIVPNIMDIIVPVLVLVAFTILIKPFLTMLMISIFGYKARTYFMSAVSLAQISEFALIIAAQGVLIGQIPESILSITILVAVITITLTSYFMKYVDWMYQKTADSFSFFERFSTTRDDLEYVPDIGQVDVVLCGYDRTGYSIFRKLVSMKREFLVIDYNPEIIRRLIKKQIPCIYGDMGNHEIMQRLNMKKMKMIISTVPDMRVNHVLIEKARHANKDVIIFVTAYHVDDALELYEAGADYVILPHFLGGEHVSLILEDIGQDVNKIIRTKLKHIRELHDRKVLGHEHPKEHRHGPADI